MSHTIKTINTKLKLKLYRCIIYYIYICINRGTYMCAILSTLKQAIVKVKWSTRHMPNYVYMLNVKTIEIITYVSVLVVSFMVNIYKRKKQYLMNVLLTIKWIFK